jgi:hypothetical protein
MKKSFNILTVVKILLVGVIAVLGYFLYSVLNENITAQEQIQVRTTAVIERSKLLKELVAMYQEANQTYPKSTDEIVEFAKNGFLIKQTEKYDPNNLGKFKEPVVGTDTVWIEKSYYHLAKEAKAEDPNWTNIISDTIYARKTILKELSDKQVEELCVIPYSNEEYRVQFLEKISDGDTLHHFRCHAPYLSFLDSKEHNQQFWNFIEEKFNYEVKNNENISEDTKKRMNADGAYKAITSEKYSIGTTPETRIVIDIEYFGITFGSLEKVTLDGNWEDPRAKK